MTHVESEAKKLYEYDLLYDVVQYSSSTPYTTTVQYTGLFTSYEAT